METLREEANRLDRIATQIDSLSISHNISRSGLDELIKEAAQAGTAGRAFLDALTPRETATERLIEIPPDSGAALAWTLGALMREGEELHVQNEAQIACLREQIGNLESHLKIIESEQLRAKSLTIEAGRVAGLTLTTVGGTTIAAEIFKNQLSEQITTTILDVAGGGGLFLIGKKCFRLIRQQVAPPLTERPDLPVENIRKRIDPMKAPKRDDNAGPRF